MKSMTAYSQVLFPLKSRRYRLEVQSLNKKGLDIQTDIPSIFLNLNIPIRLYIASKLERGSILLRLKEESVDKVGIHEEDIHLLKSKLVDLATKSGFSKDAITFEMLLDKATNYQTQDIEMKDLEPHLNECLDLLIKMRINEGQRLKADFTHRFHLISETLKQIETLLAGSSIKVKNKLLERLKQLELSGHDEERLLKEVIYYVEKQDVTEELTRLKSHMIQMNDLINSKESMGRKLEFLTQECFRELNTLSAKTSELGVINLTLMIKTEFEKIKEQVMNIE
jgi:uncharacterized protein (TIGR00255 family)